MSTDELAVVRPIHATSRPELAARGAVSAVFAP
jgi:hypothetical protein